MLINQFVPVDLSKLSDIIKNDVVKKDVYNAKMQNIEYKRPDITNLAIKTTLNAKINEAEQPLQDNELQEEEAAQKD